MYDASFVVVIAFCFSLVVAIDAIVGINLYGRYQQGKISLKFVIVDVILLVILNLMIGGIALFFSSP